MLMVEFFSGNWLPSHSLLSLSQNLLSSVVLRGGSGWKLPTWQKQICQKIISILEKWQTFVSKNVEFSNCENDHHVIRNQQFGHDAPCVGGDWKRPIYYNWSNYSTKQGKFQKFWMVRINTQNFWDIVWLSEIDSCFLEISGIFYLKLNFHLRNVWISQNFSIELVFE